MIKTYFLQAKHWQLCLLMVTPYAVYKLTGFGHNPIDWGFLLLYFMLVMLGWLYSVGSAANDKLDPQFKIPLLYFQLAAIVPFIYLPIVVFWVLAPMSRGEIQHPPQGLIFIHFATLFAVGYCVWYTAKQFTTLQNNEQSSFSDYYLAFIGFWFGFFGVWFLQPKISELFYRAKHSN
ncbi:hypothetical protein [Candidatus Spongiihabitans sp.]|uniref:hypothetical protein n=1 Tax=Candidatus Spongiihabitans sp. TaxID=3101308 RepID=UPI003C6F8591